MKKEEFCEIIGNIDEKFISEAKTSEKPHKISWKKWAALAACFGIIIGTTTVFATSDFGLRIIERFFNESETEPESGYEISADIEKIPLEEFSDGVKNLRGVFVKQHEEYVSGVSAPAEEWKMEFNTAEEAKEYSGFEKFVLPDWDNGEYTILSVTGNALGEIEEVSIFARYRKGGVSMSICAEAYTEYFVGEAAAGVLIDTEMEFEEKGFLNENGTYCLKVVPKDTEVRIMQGYTVKDGVLYWIAFTYDKNSAAEAEEIFLDWANSY